MTTKSNSNLSAARVNKNDEFYTSYDDIEKELTKYKEHFKHKIIYCNCDDPTWSQFYFYLKNAFNYYGYEKLVTTHYVSGNTSYMRVYDGSQEVDTQLTGDGDFRSDECKAILDQADIVITNPPFSLFREFVALLQQKQKQFLIIGNMNAVTYKECFKLIKDNKMWLGISPRSMTFTTANNSESQVNACWFTNLTHSKRNQPIDLYKNYSPTEYSKYHNYDAIEVSKVKDIPQDYVGVIGVPITFLDKYCPAQFEILDCVEPALALDKIKGEKYPSRQINYEGTICQKTYHRYLIKHKNPVTTQETV
jgi:hypothetical protein